MFNVKILAVIIVIICILLFITIRDKKNRDKEIDRIINKNWGKKPSGKISVKELENISHYYKKTKNDNTIDDITWNDLDMDKIFLLINNTNSSVGAEVLYKLLRNPRFDDKWLKEFDAKVRLMSADSDIRKTLQKEFIKLGFVKGISLTDYIDVLSEFKPSSNLKHYFCSIGIIISILLSLFVNAMAGVLIFIACVGYTIVSYYKDKAKVEPYFICVNHIVGLYECASNLVAINNKSLEKETKLLEVNIKKLTSLVKKASMLGNAAGMNGSLGGAFIDYIRMLTHIDLIQFNKICNDFSDKKADIYSMIDILGELESAIAVASFREYIKDYCNPELIESGENSKLFIGENLYHPLVKNPVKNSLKTNNNILLTGSNASGKSTFLKTVAINAILAQTIFTCMADKYKANYFRIMSSMALRDNIESKESYYMVEIKALKRIMDIITDTKKMPVLCFIDEVLRGTNTVERISASTQILSQIADNNALCFAATHDIELTSLLDGKFDNYHFREEVKENDVIFNYKLFEGKASSRNAIKLLSIMGYEAKVVDKAENMATHFLNTGEWM